LFGLALALLPGGARAQKADAPGGGVLTADQAVGAALTQSGTVLGAQ